MKLIPRYTVFLTNSDAPWMSPFVKHLINKRWEAFRTRNWNIYNVLKEKVRKEIFKAKHSYFKKKSSSVKGLWSFVRMERGGSRNDVGSLLTDSASNGLNRLN